MPPLTTTKLKLKTTRQNTNNLKVNSKNWDGESPLFTVHKCCLFTGTSIMLIIFTWRLPLIVLIYSIATVYL